MSNRNDQIKKCDCICPCASACPWPLTVRNTWTNETLDSPFHVGFRFWRRLDAFFYSIGTDQTGEKSIANQCKRSRSSKIMTVVVGDRLHMRPNTQTVIVSNATFVIPMFGHCRMPCSIMFHLCAEVTTNTKHDKRDRIKKKSRIELHSCAFQLDNLLCCKIVRNFIWNLPMTVISFIFDLLIYSLLERIDHGWAGARHDRNYFYFIFNVTNMRSATATHNDAWCMFTMNGTAECTRNVWETALWRPEHQHPTNSLLSSPESQHKYRVASNILHYY